MTQTAAPQVTARAVGRALHGSESRTNGAVLPVPCGRNVLVVLDAKNGDRSADMQRAMTWLEKQGYRVAVENDYAFEVLA